VDFVRRDVARARRDERQRRTAVHHEHSVDSRHLAADTAERVAEALASLPPAERDAIVRAFYGDASYRDIATGSGIPEGTIKSRIRSGLGRLRVALQELGPGWEAGSR
jgi:RNA polymerase sigma-70 factor (ECF subfamily)